MRTLFPAALIFLLPLQAWSQGGPLTPPPGPPGPTMKSLDVIEPRTPLVQGAAGVSIGAGGEITISQSGSYYLTKNLVITTAGFGIAITAPGVTVDLMGHTISYNGTGLPDAAINIQASNVAVENGHIISTTTFDGTSFTLGGFNRGVYALGSFNNVSARDINVRGTRNVGIQLGGNSSMVHRCSVSVSGTTGIRTGNGTVTACAVQTVGSTGILGSCVSDSTVEASLGSGITAETVQNCFVRNSTGSGHAIFAQTVTNSHGTSAGNYGIFADLSVSASSGKCTNTAAFTYGIYCGGTVSSSRGEAAGGQGIFAGTATGCVGTSTGSNGLNSTGILATVVTGSTGTSSAGHGISALRSVHSSFGQSTSTESGRHGIDCGSAGLVVASQGVSAGGHGIYASSVSSSRGESSGIHAVNSSGIFATQRVDLSHGETTSTSGGDGINCFYFVTGSTGKASGGSGNGIICWLATQSFGYRTASEANKYGISATQAVGCRALFGELITDKFDMP